MLVEITLSSKPSGKEIDGIRGAGEHNRALRSFISCYKKGNGLHSNMNERSTQRSRDWAPATGGLPQGILF